MEKILITGANGQIGSELKEALSGKFGRDNIIGLDIKPGIDQPGIQEIADVTDISHLRTIIQKYSIDTIFHLASLLSARGEQNPDLAWKINMGGLKNVLDLSRAFKLQVFWPSSIAVFGPSTPRDMTPQTTILEPNTMYGITKLSGELLCKYYFEKFGVDVRSVRYPGLISYKTEPGGGTTDYAVEIFYEAAKHKRYISFVNSETCLPMMYMPDAVRASIEIMLAKPENIKIRNSYNLTAVSFSVAELEKEIQKLMPEFECKYAPDYRQRIANSWPKSIDDSAARTHWGWEHQYGLPEIVKDMLNHLREKFEL